MKKLTKHLLLASITTITVVAGAVSFKAPSNGLEAAQLRVIGPTESGKSPSVCKSPARTIARDDYFYEDFEAMGMTGEFASGWLAIATPDMPDDCWGVGMLGSGDNIVSGTSGACYAYILGNRSTTNNLPHDSWLFSPGIQMKADQEYRIEFNAYMAPGPKVTEHLSVMLCTAQEADAVLETLEDLNDDLAEWARHAYTFTPTSEGTYYLAFHSTTPHGGNATMVDDLQVSPGPVAGFFGMADIYLGETDPLKGAISGYYEIGNRGEAPLTVDLDEAPEGMTVEGLPLTIGPGRTRDFTISFIPSGSGLRCGALKLTTSDPAHPEVEINVWATVNEALVTGYSYEDFEGGSPKGWKFSETAISTDYYRGHDSARCYYTRSLYTLNEEGPVGFTTNYVEMGDKPEFSLWYKLMDCDLYGEIQGPTGSENPVMQILVSDDGGNNYTPVWELGQDSGRKHQPSSDWQQITVALPQYAGKTCRVKYEIWNDANPLEQDFIILVDDICTGTRPAKDLKISALHPVNKFVAGEESKVKVKLRNIGSETASGYTLTLRDGNRVLATVHGPALESGEETAAYISWTPDNSGYLSLTVTADISGESHPDDNMTAVCPAYVLSPQTEAILIAEGQEGELGVAPIYFGCRETATQSIYLANEIGSDCGEITSIEFVSMFNNENQTEPFEVFIAETDREDFSDDGWVPDEEFTKVFEGSFYVPKDWNTFIVPFQKSFSYHGGNLVVMMRKMSDEFIVNKNFLAHATPTPRTIYSGEMQRGILVENGYATRFAVNGLPHATFNFLFPATGVIEGTVSDSNGVLPDVSVILDGTNLNVKTDENGVFKFPKVSAGAKSLSAVKYGYAPSVKDDVTVSAPETVVADIVLTAYETGSLTGTVKDGEGRPVAGSLVSLKGYADYSAWTGNDGRYCIGDVYLGTPLPYDMKIQSSYYSDWNRHGMMLEKDETAEAYVEEKILLPHKPVAVIEDNKPVVRWEAPLAEFSHDNGIPGESLGFNHGHNHTMLMTTYLEPLVIKEIRWYLNGGQDRHANFNVYVMGLDENGRPDPTDMLYMANGLDFTDNAWNSHILTEPIETDGCAVGINCDGFAGLGASASDADHPFESGRHFFAGDEYLMEDGIQDFDIFTDMLPMIRVYGERYDVPKGIDVTRPTVIYEVYRLSGENFSNCEHVGKTSELGINDLLSVGDSDLDCVYLVKAVYLSGESDDVATDMTHLSAVDGVADPLDGVRIKRQGETLQIAGEEQIATLLVHDISGQLLLSTDKPTGRIDGLTLGKNPAVVTAILKNGSTLSFILK